MVTGVVPADLIPHRNRGTGSVETVYIQSINQSILYFSDEHNVTDYNECNKNSSRDEIANVNFLRGYRTYFKILKRDHTSFSKLYHS